MDSYSDIFERFVPQEAAGYCFKLWNYFGFEFKIKRSRQTKLGDYRYNPQTKKHTITINNDLNPFSFLVTYLHEVAHLVTFEQHGHSANPHGLEWKQNFRKVAKPVLNEKVFPENILLALTSYFKNPKAASCSDPVLYRVLKQFDLPTGKIMLRQVQLGSAFDFNGRKFKKLEQKRTRAVCLELKSNKRYLISEVAEVVPVASS